MVARIPATMKAAAIDVFGPPRALTLHTLPVPKPGPREVLIALWAAGVGVWDASVRDGSWRPGGRVKFPLIPGTDGAGFIVARGECVRNLNIGDRVCAYDYANPHGGFYAEYAAVDSQRLGRVTKDLDILQAGALPTTGLTALQGIDDHLHVREGETVLIYGASGAVGTLAVQFAKHRRSRVLTTGTGKTAATLLLRLGADAVIDARSKEALEQLRALAPDGIDSALVLAAGDSLKSFLELVRSGGRVAYPNGVEPEPPNLKRYRLIAYDGIAGRREFYGLMRAVADSNVTVPIAAVYSLADAAKAHERLDRGHVLGRIVLRTRSDS
jgi:NADPH:quinone reductase-like Zn-dependent oxidoreductase